jgi:hypothetical protein
MKMSANYSAHKHKCLYLVSECPSPNECCFPSHSTSHLLFFKCLSPFHQMTFIYKPVLPFRQTPFVFKIYLTNCEISGSRGGVYEDVFWDVAPYISLE